MTTVVALNKKIDVDIRAVAKWALTFVVLFCVGWMFPNMEDLQRSFIPATWNVLNGHTPYGVGLGFYNPPWALIPILPLALLPYRVGQALYFSVSASAVVFACDKSKYPWWATLALVTSPPAMFSFMYGNFEWLLIVATLLPSRWGALGLSVKPHLAWAVLVYDFGESIRNKCMIQYIAPLCIAGVLSIVAFGAWPVVIYANWGNIVHAQWNYSLWPWGYFIIGVPCAVLAVVTRKKAAVVTRKKAFVLIASVFASPYYSMGAYLIPMFAIGTLNPYMVTSLSLGMWILALVQYA